VTVFALKIVLTPALIAIATLTGRRWGPSVGGWLVGLPFTSGPVSLFLALEQGTRFAADAAAGSIAGAAAAALFAVAYAAMARRSGWPASLAVASAVFFVAVFGLRALPLGSELPLPFLVVYLATIATLVVALRVLVEPGDLAAAVSAPRWDLPARMVVATVLVLVITGAAPLLGPQLTGLLTTYPAYASVLAVFAHSQRGGAAAIHVVRGLCYGLFAFASFFFAVGATIERMGILFAFAAAIAAALVVQSLSLALLMKRASR
jgi:uncharacterized membrane protein (UPF0136 family)